MTLVVEAADPSGSLITAEFARDLGRAVAAVPGRVTARMAEGTNGLLRDGAVPVTSIEDVLDELYGVGVRPARPRRARRGAAGRPGLRAVLDAVEAGCGRRRDRARAPGPRAVRGARGAGPTRGRRARRPRRARRLGASRHVSARDTRARAAGAYAPAPMVPDAADAPAAALDRRLGLRRRRRHPGRPEGVRRLRRARHDGDHRDHRAEHRARERASIRCPPEAIVEQVRAVAEDIGVDAVKIGMVGNADDDRGRGRGARTCCPRTCPSCSTR